MKQVLLIDDSSVFREFIKEKLTSRNITVEIGVGYLDSLAKMRSQMPDLVILDFNQNRSFIFDLLEGKKADPNAKDIPIILLAQKLSKEELTRLASFGIKTVIPKPLKIDQLFSSITKVLKIDFDIDTTACILEARVNDNIIFIEIAQGLNREKIDLLKYKIEELINLYNLSYPKILIMMTDMALSFVDGPNLELLMHSVMKDARVKNKNIKILTLDPFATEFLTGNRLYTDIQIVKDLSKALDSLLKDVNQLDDTSTVISERILSMRDPIHQETTMEMRFKSELESLKETGQEIKIAVVDDDVVIRTVLSKTFQTIKAKVTQFESGIDFIADESLNNYDLIFLDLMMPLMNGFEVLIKLKEAKIETPVIVLSAISQREAVLKVLSAGVKSYMIKPLRPDAILKKAIEVLKVTN
ncbi:MAG TPA: response regulator [Treponemataceae bacterium]|nr:response regulator [Treponemataceae bacterium]